MSLIRDLELNSLAPSSRKSYEGAWKSFKALARDLGFCPLPCSQEDFKRGLSNLATMSGKLPSIKRMMAAVTFFHKLNGFPSPASGLGCSLLMRGIKRKLFIKPKRASPLSSDIVKKLVDSLIGQDLFCTSYYDVSLRDWRTAASCVLLFAALCRFDDLCKIRASDISFEANKASIFIPRSKTDQIGEGHVVSVAASGSDSCPVFLLKAYVRRIFWEAAVEGRIYEGPLFPSLGRRRVQGPLGACFTSLPVASPAPFSYKGALADFRAALSGIGLDPKSFSLHSGRRGGATEAVINGCDLLLLKRQGRWRSDACPQLYVDDVLNNSSKFSSFLGL